MWPFRRRRPAIAQYQVETTPTQLRLIRTHQAATLSEISTLNVLVGQLGAKLDHYGEQLAELAARPAVPEHHHRPEMFGKVMR
jgi:hypothetical protein